MRAIESLLAGLIDYAGLYPPAALDMRSAVANYLAYSQSRHSQALGRFIVDVRRIEELRSVSGKDLHRLRLSVIASADADLDLVSALTEAGVPIEAVELKARSTAEMQHLAGTEGLETYVEAPLAATNPALLEVFAAAGFGVKLRMGGVVAEAFPSSPAVAEMLSALHRHGLAFKATAGLHHPFRSRHAFTYAPDSPAGTMHGFINIFCAAALIHFGGNIVEATAILDEQDMRAWRLAPGAIGWRFYCWTADHISETRKKFFRSFGSCSFEEPLRDLEELGWL
jgi:hypothetical protein